MSEIPAVDGDSPRDVDGYVVVRPAGPAARAVRSITGYSTAAIPGGVHRGLPGPWLTIVFPLGGPIAVRSDGEPGRGRHGARTPTERAFLSLVGGLHTAPVIMPQRDRQRGLQLSVHPLAARALLGLPAAEVAQQVVDLGDVLGASAVTLTEQLAAANTGADAVGLVHRWLDETLAAPEPAGPPWQVWRAWQLIVGSGGQLPIGLVAAEVGWSRRHLTTRLGAELGLGAKVIARVARFARAQTMLRSPAHPPLAEVAAACGYADQPHFSSEWRTFAGCTPGQWVATELPALPPGDDADELDDLDHLDHLNHLDDRSIDPISARPRREAGGRISA